MEVLVPVEGSPVEGSPGVVVLVRVPVVGPLVVGKLLVVCKLLVVGRLPVVVVLVEDNPGVGHQLVEHMQEAVLKYEIIGSYQQIYKEIYVKEKLLQSRDLHGTRE